MKVVTQSFEKFGLVFVPIRPEYPVRHILLDRGVVVDFNTEEARKSHRFAQTINDFTSEFTITDVQEKNMFGQFSWKIELTQVVNNSETPKKLEVMYPSDDIPFMRYKRGSSVPKKNKSVRIAA